MATTDRHHRLEEGPPTDSNNCIHVLTPQLNCSVEQFSCGVNTMRLLTPHQVHLTQTTHLFLTTKGTATMEGTALDDDDQTPQARPTQAIWINATTGTDITVDPDPEWMAIHCTLDCTKDDPTLTEWQARWAAEANRLHEVALDDTLTPTGTPPSTASGTTPLPYTQRR